MKQNFNISNDERISKILNAIMGVSAGDYQIRLIPSEKEDDIDAIMVGLNMLAEEIQSTKYSLEELLKEKTDNLSKSESKFHTLANFASEQIFIINKDFVIEYMNESAAKAFNAPPDYLIGKSIDELFPPQELERMKAPMAKAFNTGITQHVEREIKFPHNSLWVSTSYAPVWFSDRSQITSVLGISRDITERKRAENEIKEKNEQLIKLNAEKDKFFSIIAHDLKGPFNGFLNLTELMADSNEKFSPDEFIEYSKLLNEAARSLYKLLENLLEWAQVQKGAINFTPKDSDLSKMVSQSIETIFQRALQKRISIINEIVHAQKVYADEKMISTVLRNLLSNAVKFTRTDGKAIVKSGSFDNDTIEVSVEDNGVGIAEKDIHKLFKIEEKVSSKGTDGESSTGLGLLLCKEFIEMHGGKIWVESELGKGSKFKFTLHKTI